VNRAFVLVLPSLVLPWLALPAVPALASEDGAFVRNRVTFALSRTTDVANDRLSAVLVASHEAAAAPEAASRVNEAMAWALEQVRERAGEAVDHRTGSYRTQRVHTPPPTRQERWRVEQELVVESGDAEAVRDLATALQSRLELRSMSFSLSQERHAQTRRALVAETLEAFRAEADHIRQTLGFGGYEIVDLRVSEEGERPPGPVRMRAMAAESDAPAVAPLALAPGWSEVRVTVDAQIQLE